MPTFPELTERETNKFRLLRQLVTEDPAVLDRSECPYDDKTKAWLRAAFAPAGAGLGGLLAGADGSEGSEINGLGDWKDIATKSRELYRELERLAGPTDGVKLDTQEQIATVKVRAQLLDRLVTIGERATNLKLMTEFMAGVIGALEEAGVDQRTDFAERLRTLAAGS